MKGVKLEFLGDYGLFLAKTVTVLVAVLVVIIAIFSMGQRQRKAHKGHIEVTNLNQAMDEVTEAIKQVVLEPEEFKRELKQQKKDKKKEQKAQKQKEKQKDKKEAQDEQEKLEIEQEQNHNSDTQVSDEAAKSDEKPRVFVLDFEGDIRASQVISLREEVTAILSLAKKSDEILVRLESPGGLVHSYGLAASQLKRITDKGIRLIIAVDKVAASGGYMMACIADQIIAAPFALLGSIGVVAQIPNFHRLLKKNDVDVEVLTAGEYKRTLTMFGENTDKGREKFQEDMEDVHRLFKDYVTDNRQSVNIEEVATGEAWYGMRALEHRLVDELKTSDEWLFDKCRDARIFQVKYVHHKKRVDKLMEKLAQLYRNRIFGPESENLNQPHLF